MTRIDLQPVGDAGLETLDRMAAALAKMFGVSVHVHAGALDPGFAYDAQRGQYYATAILAKLAEVHGAGDSPILGVTEGDLFVPVLTFVFGEAQLQGRCAVVSRYRLREEFYGLPADEMLTAERLVKEAAHEIGHTFGLRHCDDWRCLMASSHGVERLDLKGAEFCARCGLHIRGRRDPAVAGG